MFVLPLEILTLESPFLESKSPNHAKWKKGMFMLPLKILTPESPSLESKSPDPVERMKTYLQIRKL
ncbi:hypothetical protein TIFTF001_016885 [Ficus carica]|uniref:Uncharacterized protein n=1 Tax=Ficus carica TaxID=3494 RepID=A0AA88D7R9_FICCA|nr:hypothetical protein TIFTF001_016885 [Ficus carica]